MKERIFVIDTNVLAAGLITADTTSPTARILDAMLDGSLFYLLSSELLLIDTSRPRSSVVSPATWAEIFSNRKDP